MRTVLAEAAAEGAGSGVQEPLINSAGTLVGLVSLLLVFAWWAYLYR